MSNGHNILPTITWESSPDDGNDPQLALTYSLCGCGMVADPDGEWAKVSKCRYQKLHKWDNLQRRINDANLQQAFDTVQRPAHYNQSGIECIDAIAASMAPAEFQAYLKGNVQKYLWRYQHKNGVEDCRKAQWYLDRLVKELSE